MILSWSHKKMITLHWIHPIIVDEMERKTFQLWGGRSIKSFVHNYFHSFLSPTLQFPCLPPLGSPLLSKFLEESNLLKLQPPLDEEIQDALNFHTFLKDISRSCTMELYNLLASNFNRIIERRFVSNIERFMTWNYKKMRKYIYTWC
jgi:hypothetical protein